MCKALASCKPWALDARLSLMTVIVEWDGEDLPEQMKELPKGRYIIVPVDEVPLTEEEDAGLRAALDSADAGRTRPAEDVRQRLDSMLNRCPRGVVIPAMG
jgi:predicted transcriptional regulator